ncbi:MAG: ABC transporter substrate-binding protein [Marinilabiliaceae bacterium]|nr:ABC transporter substrate-binding protein [Marinilabiliaceae bacterium]
MNNNIIEPDSSFFPKYANGFWVEYFYGYKLLKIKNPFDTLTNTKTICIQTIKQFDTKSIDADSHIFLNNQNWIALSSTQISSANLLNLKSKIIGVAEPEYISDPYIHKQLKNKKIKNVGMAMAPDIEIILQQNPAFIMVSPFPDISYHQIIEAGIAVIPNASYMETTPLGRAEWIIFMGQLFNKEKKAIQIFDSIANRYNKLKNLNININNHPTIFTGHLYQGIWHSPQRNNYMAQFFSDAHANYIFNNKNGTGTMMLEFETVYNCAHNADYWLIIINQNSNFSYSDFKAMDERYSDFNAFKKKKVIYTNASHSLFFEQSEQKPDVVLADIIHALHPSFLPDYQPTYFKLLE